MQKVSHTYVNITKKVHHRLSFFKSFVRSPLSVGSICPSGNALVSMLTQQCTIQTNGLIIDLGAGTGVVSNRLIQAGINPERILAVEIAPHLAKLFTKLYPMVSIAIGDARNLQTILNKHKPNQPVSLIISSLPFQSLPKELVLQITSTLQCIMKQHNCPLVQYSYAWWMEYPLEKYGFLPQESKIVLKNMPPARVEWYNI